MAKCKSCGAQIEWVKTKTRGSSMPVDPKYVVVVTNEGQIVKGRISHFATCPNADQHRKRNGG